MRSGATLTHGSPAGNGGAAIVSTGGRIGALTIATTSVTFRPPLRID